MANKESAKKSKKKLKEVSPEAIALAPKKTRLLSIKIFFPLAVLGALALGSLVLITTFMVFFWNRIYPGVMIGSNKVSALTLDETKDLIGQTTDNRLNQTLTFHYQSQEYQIKLSKDLVKIDSSPALDKAYRFGRSEFYFPPPKVNPRVEFQEGLDEQIKKIALSVNQPAINSQLKFEEDQINVTPSQMGKELDAEKLKLIINDFIVYGDFKNNNLPIKDAYPKLSYDSALKIKQSLDQIKLTPLKLKHQESYWTLDLATILELIDLENTQPSLATIYVNGQPFIVHSAKVGGSEISDSTLGLNEQRLDIYLSKISKEIDQEVKEPLFNFDGQKVVEFSPPVEGRTLNKLQAGSLIAQALINQNTKEIELPVETIQPKNSLTNDLGIKELLARGTSNFAGSIPNRIFNVSLAASRINGILIRPGEEFSFVNTVGDISAATGYKQAYVIKSGRTVLDDGGGVCQVSTTVFRAALNAGLPITARTAHAYRVSYYEQGFPPGLDATIFHPTVDLKFKNDTTHHILIQARAQGTTLHVDLYGTSDGRVATITKPIVTNITPAPPELRQDDPTLPKGEVKQVDWAASGANVVFSRTVKKGGEIIINETFRSNFRPWQAVFLVGTKEG